MATSRSVKTNAYDGRYYELTWSAEQSIVNNQSTISWVLKAVGGNASWYAERTLYAEVNGSVVVNKTDRVQRYAGTIASGTKIVTHDNNGKANLSIKIRVAVYVSDVNCTVESTVPIDDIPRASEFGEITGNTIGSDITVKINRKVSSYTHQLWYKLGNSDWYDLGTGIGTSITFKPDMALCSQLPDTTIGTLELCIRTFNGSSRVGNDVYKNMTVYVPDSVKPSCEIAITDASGYADTYGYIKGLSKLKVVVKPKTSYGSAIAIFSTLVNGETYNISEFTTGILQASGTLEIKSTVKDKRGRIGSAITSIDVSDYSPPVITKLAVGRCDSDGTKNDNGEYVKVTFSGNVSSVGGQNTSTYTLSYKKTKESSYTDVELQDYDNEYSVAEATYIFAADSGFSFNVRLTITDAFQLSVRETKVSTAVVKFHIPIGKNGFAIGKILENDNMFEVGFQTRLVGGMYYDVLTSGTDLDTQLVPNTYYLPSSNTYKNAPEDGRGMILEILGNGGALMHRVTINSKTNPVVYERYYYSNAWGNWLRISDFGGSILWSGSYLMNASQTATLSEKISEQKNGIIMIFSLYLNGTAKDENFSNHFVSKKLIEKVNGAKTSFFMANASFSYIGCKTLNIYDDKITGYDQNSSSGTVNGITYKNNNYVLRYVIGT